MSGIPVVVVPNGGLPVRSVDSRAPVMTIADNGMGIPITYSNNGAPFVVRGGGSAWTPSSLFKNGEQGWLMDLSLASMFQDAAGTIPVTELGQPVGRVVDQSGRGNHWTQPTALNRPIYQVDAEGKPYLSFNGTNQWMQTAAFDWGSDEVTHVVGVRKLSDAAAGFILEFSPDTNNNLGTFACWNGSNTGGGPTYRLASKGSAIAVAMPEGVYASPITNLLSSAAKISTDTAQFRINGALAGSSSEDQGVGNFGNYPLFIGARNGTANFFNGNMYPSLGINRLLNEAELASAEDWVAKRTGGLAQ